MRAEKKLIRNPISSAFDLQHLQKNSFDVAKKIFQIHFIFLRFGYMFYYLGGHTGPNYIHTSKEQSVKMYRW